jgi:hypothetical protein
LDLDFLTKRKDNVEVPQGIDTPMWFCGNNCKLVRCNVLGYAYGMRFFMCDNYAHDPIQLFDPNLRDKVKIDLLHFSIIHLSFELIFANMSLEKDSTSSLWFHAMARYRAVQLRQEVRRERSPWCNEGLKRRTREGEWMGADKNSIQEFDLWTRIHSCTSTSFSCQVHVATEVLLNLGARPNQQPQHTHSGNTHDTAAGSPNRLGRFLKPVRPLLLDLASRKQGKPVRPVWQTGQTDFVQKLPKNPKHLKSLSTSEQKKP